jgi:hypothetical protein
MVGSTIFSALISALAISQVITATPIRNASEPRSLLKRKSPSLEKRTFSVTQAQNSADQFDGAWALKKAYLKHGIPLPEHLKKRQLPIRPVASQSVTAPGTGSVNAYSISNDLEYVSPVTVGSTTMRLDFDTGSSDL